MFPDPYFPLAWRYPPAPESPGRLRENSARFRVFPYTERHLQCVWFDPALRPAALATHDGEPVEVEDPGVWNLEAGPDFLGAALRVGRERRRLRGDVELHIHPHDWCAHQHRADPRYANVRAHVTFFDGALADGELPPGALQIALRAPLAARPAFAFDTIDVAAYPYAARAATPPCQVELRGWTPDAKEALLDAAGQERLRRKAVRLAIRIDEAGPEQTLYEETLAVLGYKHNKLPFRSLAARVPLAELRQRSGGDPRAALAILLGVAGLLPAQPAARWDDATRANWRALWDHWFKLREHWAHRLMEPAAWRLAGLRPANQPVRRIAAAAALFAPRNADFHRLADRATTRAATILKEARESLAGVGDAWWDHRYTWGGKPLAKPVALIGDERIQLVETNVLLPLLAARGIVKPFAADLLADLPPEGENQVVRQTAFNLFGPHHPTSWTRTGARRQGLIQIFHDYCLNDRSRCATCPFPALLGRRDKGT
ncbi:MAG TPA: DUF2851 family protein [Kiritimatiellia bacterium]|nr:DUF2851 family protein [Kiritimatiellia bacterium]